MTAPACAFLAALVICFGCAISSTLSAADPSGRRRSRRATVQLKLAFLDHAYDRIDLGLIWDTIATDLPNLKADAERALASLRAPVRRH